MLKWKMFMSSLDLYSQESEVVYCNRLSLVADLLQGLFKEAYALQKSLLELLDQISLDSGASEEDISGIVTSMCHMQEPVCFGSMSVIC